MIGFKAIKLCSNFPTFSCCKEGKISVEFFYHNVNGLELNDAIRKQVQTKNMKQKEIIINEVEQYTKVEVFLK